MEHTNASKYCNYTVNPIRWANCRY